MSQKELYSRFKVQMGLGEAIAAFAVKIKNILIHGPKFNEYQFSKEIAYLLCVELGIQYQTGHYLPMVFPDDLSFNECLVRHQSVLNILWRTGNVSLANRLGAAIEVAIKESPVDLGIGIKLGDKVCPEIHWAGAGLLDEVVDDVLGLLLEPSRAAISAGFNKCLKEMLSAGGDSERLRNVVRDMQVACDEVVKWTFSDRGLGLAHLFKENRGEILGLHPAQRQMFFHFNDWMDKAVKHSAVGVISKAEAEFAIFIGSTLVRLVIHRAVERGLPGKVAGVSGSNG